MLRLIIKDYRSNLHIIASQMLLIIVVLTFGLIFDRNGTLAIVTLLMYPMSLPTVLLLIDGPYESLTLSLPVSRRDYVLSKFVGGLLASFTLISVGLLYGYILNTNFITDGIYLAQVFDIKGLFIFILPLIVINSIIYPVFFKFSKEKGSLVLIILIVLIFIATILGFIYIEKNLIPKLNYSNRDIFPVINYYLQRHIEEIGVNNFIFRITLATLFTFLSSIMLSLKIFEKKNIGGA